MKNILGNIAKFRKEKGLSYENMANELNLSVGAYRKIELAQTHLTVERLYQISETLQITVAKILEIESEQYNQTNKDHSTGYLQKIEHFYQENKEAHQKLFAAQEKTIAAQEVLIIALQSQVGLLEAQVKK